MLDLQRQLALWTLASYCMMGGLSDNRCPLSGTAVVRGPFVLRNPSGGTFALSATQTALCPCGVVTSVRFYTLDSNGG